MRLDVTVTVTGNYKKSSKNYNIQGKISKWVKTPKNKL